MKKLLLQNRSLAASEEIKAPSLTRLSLSYVLLAILILIQIMGLLSCKKSDPLWPKNNQILPETEQQLKNAREATAKYQDIKNAVADGYADINVVRQNMGFHYLKASLLDTVFDATKPELLVYNKMHDGHIALVALEYAIPINLRPNAAPEGFAGSADVWKYDTDFGLWLLHAWVWEYNPDGVFNPTNSAIHLH